MIGSFERESPLYILFLDHPLVLLLRKHGKDEQAEDVMKGQLTELSFYRCYIGDTGAEIVADFLKHDETVTEVCLWDCNIRLHGVEAIAATLERNETVKSLDLRSNKIGDDGARALINAFAENVCITQLFALYNGIDSRLLMHVKYLTETRNQILIPAAARRASLCLIAARQTATRAGDLAIFPKEIVMLIALQVYATRRDTSWIQAVRRFEAQI